MRIAIDAHPTLKSMTGVGFYTFYLIKALQKQITEEDDLLLFFNKTKLGFKLPSYWDGYPYRNVLYPYGAIRRLLKPNLLYNLLVERFLGKIDIFHATNFIYLPTNGKLVVTIHDLAFLRFPELADDSIYRHHKKWLLPTVKQADRIIVDSMATKSDVCELLNVKEGKIRVIYLAADDDFRPLRGQALEKVRERYNLPQRFILYLGTLEPRKNLPSLIKAFAKVKKVIGFPEKLVLAGGKGWKCEQIFQTVGELGLEEEVIFPGYIYQEDLPALYNLATVFCFPSLYEGFGLPVLEAMQCGVPVVCSSGSSLPEIAGNAALMVDPYSEEDLAEKLGRVLEDEELRVRMSKLGLERVKQFSWDKTAYETLNVYRSLL